MSKAKWLEIVNIDLDVALQPRAEISAAVVEEYAAEMEAGCRFPPVSIVSDGKTNWLWDGYHRLLAVKKRGEKRIDVDISGGTKERALWLSLGANRTHGLRRTNADKERAVRKALEQTVGKSDRDIAEHLGVDHKTVTRIRHQRESGGEIPHLNERIGKDGKTYPAHPKQGTAKTSEDIITVYHDEWDNPDPPEVGLPMGDGEPEVPMGDPATVRIEIIPMPETDEVGNPIEGKIADAFGRKGGLTILAGEASHLKSRIQDSVANDDELFADVNLSQVEADLDNVARALRAAMPYAICPYCSGDGCQACRSRGWVGRITYDAAPEEMKLGGLIAEVQRLGDELAAKHASGYSAVGAVQDELGLRGIKPVQYGRDRLTVYRDRLVDLIGKL